MAQEIIVSLGDEVVEALNALQEHYVGWTESQIVAIAVLEYAEKVGAISPTGTPYRESDVAIVRDGDDVKTVEIYDEV